MTSHPIEKCLGRIRVCPDDRVAPQSRAIFGGLFRQDRYGIVGRPASPTLYARFEHSRLVWIKMDIDF